MSRPPQHATAGWIGRTHGLDGSFYVEAPTELLERAESVVVAGREAAIERRAGSSARPILRLSGVEDRQAAAALHGERLLVEAATGELDEGEYLAGELVGCDVPGLGAVRRVLPGPSCDLLEVGEGGELVPLVSDAIRRIDVDARLIEVDRGFLGLDAGGAGDE